MATNSLNTINHGHRHGHRTLRRRHSLDCPQSSSSLFLRPTTTTTARTITAGTHWTSIFALPSAATPTTTPSISQTGISYDLLEQHLSGQNFRQADEETRHLFPQHLKSAVDQYQSDLLSVVNSLMLSINEVDLHIVKSGKCNGSYIRYSLVKLLSLSGYDAGVCVSKWQGHRKVPGGEHEYIDVINYYDGAGNSERVIIDVDFRSHFEIARAVESYDRILDSLPVVYVGTLTKLKQFLQVMVEAAKLSLKQNLMPLPPWRSFAYLQAKWESPYQRKFNPDDPNISRTFASHHIQCIPHLKRLQSTLQSETEVERILRPVNNDRARLNLRRGGYPLSGLYEMHG